MSALFALPACSTVKIIEADPPPDAGPEFADSGSVYNAPGNEGCSTEAKLIYVLSIEGDLYSFRPLERIFTRIGPLNCGPNLIPVSMAVDRNAIAWVNLRPNTPGATNGTLYRVDTRTGACAPTNITGTMGGMGFSLNAGTTDQETLYVISQGSQPTNVALRRVDFTTQTLAFIADILQPIDLELTGTGDGKLFGFVIDKPLALAQLDKNTARVLYRVDLPQVEAPLSPMFAFSFWGGDFYVYTATDRSPNKTSNVTRARPSDGTVDTAYMTNIGFHIVGAGVSTCAPVTAPK